MEFTLKLEQDDWLRYQKTLGKLLVTNAKSSKFEYLKNFLLWIVIALGFMVLFNFDIAIDWPTAFGVTSFFGILFVVYLYNFRNMQKAFYPLENGAFLQERKFEVSDEGMEVSTGNYKGKVAWSYISKVERLNGFILMFIDSNAAYVFPESKMEDAEKFYAYVTERCGS